MQLAKFLSEKKIMTVLKKIMCKKIFLASGSILFLIHPTFFPGQG